MGPPAPDKSCASLAASAALSFPTHDERSVPVNWARARPRGRHRWVCDASLCRSCGPNFSLGSDHRGLALLYPRHSRCRPLTASIHHGPPLWAETSADLQIRSALAASLCFSSLHSVSTKILPPLLPLVLCCISGSLSLISFLSYRWVMSSRYATSGKGVM